MNKNFHKYKKAIKTREERMSFDVFKSILMIHYHRLSNDFSFRPLSSLFDD